jgi:ribonuclease HI
MELLAVIKSIEFIDEKFKGTSLVFFTDSQYVHRIPERKEKLKLKNFLTKKGSSIQNDDLVKKLIHQIETHTIDFIKVKAHQKPDKYSLNTPVNYNCEVDKLARETMRQSGLSVDMEELSK